MKRLLTLVALLLLAQCKTFHLPNPGEPVAANIDEREALRDAMRDEREANDGPRYTDPAQQQAFDDGYAAGFLDHQRGKPSDPDAHLGKINAARRDAFTAGYLAGFAK